jgi:1,4-dihydroxy-2-naphthoyl-CoA synthase
MGPSRAEGPMSRSTGSTVLGSVENRPGDRYGMPDYETLLYRETDGVAWVTTNRPEVHNAFNFTMQDELKDVWQSLRRNDDVRCVVLTGAGDKAFCVGIDRMEAMGDWSDESDIALAAPTRDGATSSVTPWHSDDPGDNISPKSNDLWKPVIAAVNGITACFESMHMLQKMPFGEIMRVGLLGASERMTAQRAHQIGLVSGRAA